MIIHAATPSTEAWNYTPRLSERQVDVIQAIADGLSTREAADQLYISQSTVRNHLHAISRELNTNTMVQSVVAALRLGIIDLERTAPGTLVAA